MISVNRIIFLILNDWKCDKCRWHHYGRKSIKGIIKDCYVSVSGAGTNPSFKRYAYHIPEDACNRVLIHYVGKHEVATTSCHGNNKVMRTLTRTCPSVLRTAEKTDKMLSVDYKGEISYSDYSPQYQPVLKLHNTKHIANLQHSHRQKFRFSHDGLYNIHELSYDLGGFVHKITMFSDLVIVCGMRNVIKDFDRLLQSTTTQPQLLSYDTTFQLGDFYV